jgi:hypothetical protein
MSLHCCQHGGDSDIPGGWARCPDLDASQGLVGSVRAPTSPSGANYYGDNMHGQQAEGELADELEQTGHHGGCAEVHCLIQAQAAEGPEAIKGGTIRTVRTRNNSMPTSGTTGHGEPAHPCGRCVRLLDESGIG